MIVPRRDGNEGRREQEEGERREDHPDPREGGSAQAE